VIGASPGSFNSKTSKELAMSKYKGGHAPGHYRDCFERAVEAFMKWKGRGPEPMVEFEINYVPTKISVSQACGLLWNCTDILPGWIVDEIEELGLKSRTYAAGARAMRRSIAELA
jgi:hypothetical protein